MNRGNWLADLMEQARQKKEREQEQKRQTHLEEREHRREERETHTLRINIGLAIFAGLAAIAALWQGFESHRATKYGVLAGIGLIVCICLHQRLRLEGLARSLRMP